MDAAFNDTARALEILSQPAKVVVAGPKPLGNRSAWLRLAKATLLYSAILVGSTGGAFMTGLPQDYFASKHPTAAIESAPINVHWITTLPSSPFLEAGRTKDGSLSTMQMIQAWREAGLRADDVDSVRKALPALMPTLMGREDAHLELELIMDAQAAARQLEQTFPEVTQHLRMGTSGKLTAGEQQQWEENLLDLEQAFYTDSKLPEKRTLGDAVAMRVAGEGSMNYGSSLSANFPLLKVGLNEDGTLNPAKLADAWQKAGIELPEAMILQEELTKTIPDLSRGSLQDKLERAKDAQDMRGGIRERFEMPLARLLTKQTVTLSDEQTAEWHEFRSEFVAAVQANPVAYPTMRQARQALEAAIVVTGLRSLSLSVENWASPQELMRNATRLLQANAELEQATGWQGQVLGLNGRIELMVGKPMKVDNADGVTLADDSGRLQLTTDWNALGHEWFHALDYTIGRMGIQYTNGSPMSDNLEPLRKRKDATVFDAMKVAERALREQAPEWQEHREEASKKGNTGYWVRPAEGMAYAFAAQLKHQGVQALRDSNADLSAALTPARAPSSTEVTQQTAVFKTLFAKTAYLQLSNGPIPPAPALQKWRTERGAPLAAKREATLR